MKQDRELEIRRQFLDEAQEYLDTLDATILGLANHPVDATQANAALRAAHSIKGGAGMMGFQVLSELAHRLEDSWKVLKIDKSISLTPRLENLLLAAVSCLRQVVEFDRDSMQRHQASCVDANWLAVEAYPVFDALHSELGDPQEENAASVLSPEDGQDIVPLLFETEVEGCLQRLESVLAAPDQPCLREEVAILAQELGGLGEMLQLTNFIQLCQSVSHQIEQGETVETAQSALKAWRIAQTFAIAGQYDQIPTSIAGAERVDFAAPAIEVVEPSDWFTEALAADSFDDAAYPDFQPIPAPARSRSAAQATTPAQPQVTDFKVLEAEPEPVTVAEDQDATVRVPVRQLNQLNDLFGELTVDRNGLDLYLKRLRSLARTLHERVQTLDQANAKLRLAYDRVNLAGVRTLGENRRPEFDALELDRYGDLHLLSQQVMETIVQLQEVSEDIDLSLDDTEQSSRNLNKTAKQMQSGLSQLRMRPISDILDRFPRALREWSLQYGKPVRFDMAGGSTLIDRNILETLNDPLMHLLRNAFDHGIEAPSVRESKNKSPEGVIEIRAFNEGNRTIITVRDDGEGIPIQKIRDRAEQMGLDPVLLDAARDEELLSLIFEPGFSTSSQVTALSGRGVGMDVVRNNLKQIRGEISVNTKAGLGTTFTLSVPFTLSTVKVLLVESAGMLLAFPTDVVSELVLLQPDQIIQAPGSELLNWQNRMVQLVRLQKWMRFNCPKIPHGFETPPTIATPSVLMLDQNPQWFGVYIDRCWGEQEATIRKVEGNLPLPSGFSGCTILGDGRVVPLVNAPELLRWITSCERSETEPELDLNFRAQLKASLSQRPELPGSLVPTVLVVDDSINVRRFLALTLERSGYRVEQAKDGQDAIERLESGLAVQAVICDIEMPRLDGYGFLAKMRSDTQFAQVPVMMLTSRSGEKHRKLAENLGASAYFSKPYNEQVLLKTLEKMVNSIAVV
ncbi:hybrid sensor histidine kinase/response regulator [Leptolyngbya sp. FACHB-17]|uniref:hybrid sensor histidine kinase/response regulator n=1 Tax=unclassified Leptolyngbya TaxID=2650499 RepID=UPI001681435E|nr:hybrid sensor histidine kinase/response regulator [Leptolyngbya sp. FACHB-17]MBD2080098.1 hybrid sensor histidine kinase/response regulator [Leptolyngbya sp. FACHB-17]